MLSDGSAFPRRGRINFSDTRVNPTTGTYEMRADLPNGDDYLTVLTILGTIFRLIDSVKWACEGLAGDRALRVLPLSVSQFRFYLDGLAKATLALPGLQESQ